MNKQLIVLSILLVLCSSAFDQCLTELQRNYKEIEEIFKESDIDNAIDIIQAMGL